mmetsp:Transcript_32414/g.108162  ORF Transcript_32414/g.108162 Transcript_32414/m.108162 type:complete len:314 (-) Transcript_32414:24-965(-)
MARWPGSLARPLRSGLSIARGSIGGSSDSGGVDAPVALVLTHALGFSKECWAPVLEELAPLLRRRRLEWVALDFSGHGASASSPPTGLWDEYHVAEAREVLQSELRAVAPASRTVGVGHSMGGAVLAALELRQPGSLARVAAIEPPIFPAAIGRLSRLLTSAGLNPLANAAAQRRRAWPSAAAAREHFGSRMAAGWDSRSLDAFLSGALRDAPGGGVELCCDPATEARCLGLPLVASEVAAGYDGGAAVTLVTCSASRFSPLLLPGSGPAAYSLVAQTLRAGVVRLPGASHLVVQEQPALVARLVADEVAAIV